MSRRTASTVATVIPGLGALALGLVPFICGPVQAATVTLPPITLGGEARSSFRSTDIDDDAAEDVNDFSLDSARLNINGAVTETIKFTINTDYKGDGDNSVQIIDAIARFEFSPTMNIWAGRFLPPSDRANLYGPYFANNFGVYVDGVQDGYPFVAAGRDNGLAFWGDFNRLKVSVGLFDAGSTLGDQDTVVAGRLHYSFWDIETGYYLNGTYYGGKDILSIGVAGHAETSGTKAYTADILMEKKVGNGGAFTFEGEYAKYDEFGGYTTAAINSPLPGPAFTESDGFFGLVSYLFPQPVGIGKFQVLAKFAETDYENGVVGDFSQETTEFNLNYVIKAFDARLSLFFIDSSYDDVAPDVSQIGLGVQVRI
ncbi:MAG: hypothetical protein ACT4PZ_11930 [Panacagrimonas sp.]